MLRTWRVWRIRRAYRRIARLEVKVTDLDMAELRSEFFTETAGMIDRSLRASGYSRRERRAFKRSMVRQ